jgi:hypothetical protein
MYNFVASAALIIKTAPLIPNRSAVLLNGDLELRTMVDVGGVVGAGEGIDEERIVEGLNVGIDDGARVKRSAVEDDTEVTYAITEVTEEANEPLLREIPTLTEKS